MFEIEKFTMYRILYFSLTTQEMHIYYLPLLINLLNEFADIHCMNKPSVLFF